MNFIRFKQVIIIILAIPALYFFCLLFISFINKPLIEDINVPDMTNFEFQSNQNDIRDNNCLLYTSPSPRDGLLSRMPSSA